jgi:hypothetical protein
MDSSGILHKTDKLRQLILDNPTLPLLVFANENANDGDYFYEGCTSVRTEVGECLDYTGPNDEMCYLSRDELKEDLAYNLLEEHPELGEKEYEELVQQELEKYESHWIKCIIMYVGR